MSNCTITINVCKIFEFAGKQGKAWGKLLWEDGTATLEQKFQTTNPNVISIIEANRSAESEFKISATVSLGQGYGKHEGKTFNNWDVIGIESLGGQETKKFNAREVVSEAMREHESNAEDTDDEMPF